MRIFNTYGPRMNPNDGRVVSNFIVQALQGGDITIYCDGQQTRSFCYVDGLIDGMIRLMRLDPAFTGNPLEFTTLELAEKVLQPVRGLRVWYLSPYPRMIPGSTSQTTLWPRKN